MIVLPQLVKRILAGRDAEVRIPAGDESDCRFVVGRHYGMKTRSKGPEIGRLRALGVTEQTLEQVSDDEAARSGFTNREELFDWWRDRYRDGPASQPRIWVVRVELDREHRVTLLHKHSQFGYTDKRSEALHEEMEGVEPSFLKQFSEEAQTRFRRDRTDETRKRDARARAARMREVENRARKQGLDVDAHLRQVDQVLDEMDRLMSEQAA